MPIILASLVFAVALAALPSTEPPDDEEQRAYVAYIAAQREKKRLRQQLRLAEAEAEDERNEEERRRSAKIGYRRKMNGINLTKENVEKHGIADDDRQVQCSRHIVPSFGLRLGLGLDSERAGRPSTRSSQPQTRSRVVSEFLPSPPPSTLMASSRPTNSHGHLRRSSSVPSFGRQGISSGSTSRSSSAASSPESSPRLCSTPLL
ncbi:hypothetical protein IAT40_003137 [Kwoniella sp. CBS 6097]